MTLRAGRMTAVTAKVRRAKVVCYVVVGGRLLVFRHVDYSPEEVGIQVPAGTVDPGEDPADAAVRECWEETGLEGLRLIRKLGTAEYDITPYRYEIQERHFFELTVDGEVPERWDSAETSDGQSIPFECFWIPLAQGHVLQSGQGALLGQLFDSVSLSERG
jgi:8-oxo-dGTP pyrophosphatase MutT (NUDIX family)